MKDTFADRFGETFWTFWQEKIEPAYSAKPVVVDLGTGPGLFLEALVKRYPGIHAVGVECAQYMLEAAIDLPAGAEIVEADLHDPKLPFTDGEVDVVASTVVIHEMNQPIRTLRETHRCLKRGGLFYFMDWVRVPLAQYLQNAEVDPFDPATSVQALEDVFVHFVEHNRFALADLKFMLEKIGFEIIDCTELNNGQHARLVARKC
jgi:ubiquinone/menaquinone biosynthesis C-methylase UbiE